MKIKFLQYNIAACRNFDRNNVVDHARTLETIKSFNADIITLNEVDRFTKRSGNADQIEFFANELGYSSFFAHTIDCQGGKYGIALLTKYKIVSVEQIRIPDTVYNKETGAIHESRTLYSAILDVDGTPVRVIGTHYGLTNEEQEKAVDATLKLIDADDCPTVFSGDLNMTPDNPLIKKLSEKLFDTVALCKEECLTFPSILKEDQRRVKIDYVFTHGAVKTEFAESPDVRVSDHKPYFCELSI